MDNKDLKIDGDPKFLIRDNKLERQCLFVRTSPGAKYLTVGMVMQKNLSFRLMARSHKSRSSQYLSEKS